MLIKIMLKTIKAIILFDETLVTIILADLFY